MRGELSRACLAAGLNFDMRRAAGEVQIKDLIEGAKQAKGVASHADYRAARLMCLHAGGLRDQQTSDYETRVAADLQGVLDDGLGGAVPLEDGGCHGVSAPIRGVDSHSRGWARWAAAQGACVSAS